MCKSEQCQNYHGWRFWHCFILKICILQIFRSFNLIWAKYSECDRLWWTSRKSGTDGGRIHVLHLRLAIDAWDPTLKGSSRGPWWWYVEPYDAVSALPDSIGWVGAYTRLKGYGSVQVSNLLANQRFQKHMMLNRVKNKTELQYV